MFIDDFVSFFDENYLIELVIDLVELICFSELGFKFIVFIYNLLFYNVFYNGVKVKNGYIFKCYEDGIFDMEDKKGDLNKSFFYYLYIKYLIE